MALAPLLVLLVLVLGAALLQTAHAIPARDNVAEDVDLGGGCTGSLIVSGTPLRHVWRTAQGDQVLPDADGAFWFVGADGARSTERWSCALPRPTSAGSATKTSTRSVGALSRASVAAESAAEVAAATSLLDGFAPKLSVGASDGPGARRRLQASGVEVDRNLVLMLRFADHASRTLPSKSDYEVLFNGAAEDPLLAPTGSVRMYYDAQSYGELRIDSVLTDWITVSFTEAQAAGGTSSENVCNGMFLDATCATQAKLQAAVAEALSTYEASLPPGNLTNISMFTVVHSGYGAEWGGIASATRIWSHQSTLRTAWTSTGGGGVTLSRYIMNTGLWDTTGSSIAHLGVLVHELGHFLGLPDLYDRDDSSWGVASYCLMADAWGPDGTQLYPGSFSAPSKFLLGWGSGFLTRLLREGGNMTAPATVTLPAFQTSGRFLVVELNYGLDAGTQLTSAQARQLQYFIVENRRDTGWDALRPSGLMVWHVSHARLADGNVNDEELKPDEPGTWADEHYFVRLVQPDGLYNLETNARTRATYPLDTGDVWTNTYSTLDDSSDIGVRLYADAVAGQGSGHVLSAFSASATNMTLRHFYSAPPTSTRQPAGEPSNMGAAVARAPAVQLGAMFLFIAAMART